MTLIMCFYQLQFPIWLEKEQICAALDGFEVLQERKYKDDFYVQTFKW